MSSNISVASTTPTASGLPTKKAPASDIETATTLPKTAEAKVTPNASEGNASAEKPANKAQTKTATSVYAYETARQDFESAKKINPDAYKQYALNGSDLKAESVLAKDGQLTRFETGTIVKESKAGNPVTVTSPNGLVIESAILNKNDVEQELAKIDQNVDALNLKNPKSEINDITEKQLTHNLAESEIWGITMSNPDAVTINEKTEDIDVTTPSGVFHLDKQDNIHFDRADGKAKVTLTPSLKTEKAPSPEGEVKVPSQEVATEEKAAQNVTSKKLSLTA
jgi:hypothetical protein